MFLTPLNSSNRHQNLLLLNTFFIRFIWFSAWNVPTLNRDRLTSPEDSTRWPRGNQTVTPRPMFRVTGGLHSGSRIASSCSSHQLDKAFVFNNLHTQSRESDNIIGSYPHFQAVLKNKHMSNHRSNVCLHLYLT